LTAKQFYDKIYYDTIRKEEMTASSHLGPLIGIWIGSLILLIMAWNWEPIDLVALGVLILLGIPVYFGVRGLWR